MKGFSVLFFLLILISFFPAQNYREVRILTEKDVVVGAARFDDYLQFLKGKRVGIVANITSRVGNRHLVDTLLALKVKVAKIFSPEHGFRGDADAGEKVNNGKDPATGITVVSLFGKHMKPTREDLKDLDVILYDIQDVGVRFYTYISTMTYVMEACAENKKKCIILDRPNPNGFYVDGPILDLSLKSFLGLHPVPIVYGMTCGEYAKMINEEGWLSNRVVCDVIVIPVKNYTHSDLYQLPIKPSPNLPNMMSVYLYPSLGLFEGTVVSVGRGTDFPFQVLGHPKLTGSDFSFVPVSLVGAKSPKYVNEKCYGYDLRRFGEDYAKNLKEINLLWLTGMYQALKGVTTFFDANFNFHAGNAILQEQIKNGVKESEITKTWKPALRQFKQVRSKYLLYPDFE
jgi:uncharacterized protein YbbC (DUF1343 family)